MQRVSRENARVQAIRWVGSIFAIIIFGWITLLLEVRFDFGEVGLYLIGAIWAAGCFIVLAFLLRWGLFGYGREIFVSEMSERGFHSGLFGKGGIVEWQGIESISFSGHHVAFGPVSKWFFNAGICVEAEDGKKHNFRLGCYADPRAATADFLRCLTRANPGYQDEGFVTSCETVPGRIEYGEDIWVRYCRESAAVPRSMNRIYLALWWGVLRYGVLLVLLSCAVMITVFAFGIFSYEGLLKNLSAIPLLVWTLLVLPWGWYGKTLLRYLDLLVLARQLPPVDAETLS